MKTLVNLIKRVQNEKNLFQFQLIVAIMIMAFILFGCGKSETEKQTKSFCTELNTVFDSDPKPEKLVSDINGLLSKYPKADPKLRSTFLEYIQLMKETMQQPSWLQRAAEGLFSGLLGAKGGLLGVAATMYDNWQQDENHNKKQGELKNRWEQIKLKLDELTVYLKENYSVE
jgi:hypothetical protein